MFPTTKGYLFIGQNVFRSLSILALVLVFASNVVILAHDIMAVHHPELSTFSGTDAAGNSEIFECDYFEGSSVPNQAAGIFWAVVNRLFILGLTALLVLSEIGWPEKFFVNYMPVFGPDFGVGILGAVQWIIVASVLSHHVDEFPLAAGWLLFVIGCFNILLGLIFRSKLKVTRSISGFRAERSKLLPTSGPNFKNLESAQGSMFSNRSVGQHFTGDSADSGLSGKGAAVAGFGFGRQGEKKAGLNGFNISAPISTLPKYAPPYRQSGGSDKGERI